MIPLHHHVTKTITFYTPPKGDLHGLFGVVGKKCEVELFSSNFNLFKDLIPKNKHLKKLIYKKISAYLFCTTVQKTLVKYIFKIWRQNIQIIQKKTFFIPLSFAYVDWPLCTQNAISAILAFLDTILNESTFFHQLLF